MLKRIIVVIWIGLAGVLVTGAFPIPGSFTTILPTPPGQQAGDEFGAAIAIDGNTAVVTAPNHDDGNGEPGAAYVYTYDASVWTFDQELNPSDADGKGFGDDVDISGDLIVVGAWEDNGFNGAVYVFERVNGIWSQEGKYTAPDGEAGDSFGYSVAINGNTMAVGATGYDAPADGGGTLGSSGAVYAFQRSGNTFLSPVTLIQTEPAASELLGHALDVQGNTILAGAPGADSAAGAAYLFTRTGADWSSGVTDQQLTAETPISDARFGHDVALGTYRNLSNTPVNAAVVTTLNYGSNDAITVFSNLDTTAVRTGGGMAGENNGLLGDRVAFANGLVFVTAEGEAFLRMAHIGPQGNVEEPGDMYYWLLYAHSGVKGVAADNNKIMVGFINDAADDLIDGGHVQADLFHFQPENLVPVTPQNGEPVADPTANLQLGVPAGDEVKKGSGTITIRRLADDTVFESIDVNSSQVTIGPGPFTNLYITIDPASDLAYGTGYYVELPPGTFYTLDDIPLSGFNGNAAWHFTTVAQGDSTPPQVTEFTPPGNAPVDTNITFKFSEPVRVKNGYPFNWFLFTCEPSTTYISLKDATVRWNEAGNEVTIDPWVDLPTNQTCTGELKAPFIVDGGGNPVADEVLPFVFTTAGDTIPPQVSSTTPSDDAPLDSDIKVTFSEPVSVNGDWFSITCTPSNTVVSIANAAVSASVGANVYTIDPNADLPASETCEVLVRAAQVSDTASNALGSDYTHSFTTGLPADSTPPQVTATTPADNAALTSNITLTFSEPVTVDGDWFSITCVPGNAVINTTNSVTNANNDSTVYTINPNTNLPGSETCEILVRGTQVQDAALNTLNSDFTTSFTTDTPLSPYDVNDDGIISPADAIYVINERGAVNEANAAADVDGNGSINDADANAVIAQIGETP